MLEHVIGAGLGRTGTYSLKLALNQLGLGPCHHMEEVLQNHSVQVPLWNAALSGQPEWDRIYDGYHSAVDWPTAAFYRQLHEAFPRAKFVLTVRSAESWAASFSSTIYTLLAQKASAPPELQSWLDMAERVVTVSNIPPGLDEGALQRAFEAHNLAVQAAIPADQLLVFEVKQGWEPLCRFVGKPVPDTPFPRTNDRGEFWDMVSGKA